MSHLVFIVEGYLSGCRVDTFLSRHLRNYTVWRLQRMVRCGCVRVNDVRVPLQQRVFAGERVEIRLLEPPDKLLAAEPAQLNIVYEDPWLLAVDKPPGVIAHPVGERQSRTLCNAIQAHFDEETGQPGLMRPGIVHRLDRMTSGLMVVAKEHLSHRRLSLDFQNSRVQKRYLAICHGYVERLSGSIQIPIGRRHDSILMSTAPNARRCKPAVTDYRVLSRTDESTLVLAEPKTGRNHQIRVHLATIGHPLFGDRVYGRLSGEADGTECRHALHAAELQFAHPITGDPVRLASSLPTDLRQLLDHRHVSSPIENR